MKNRQLEPQSRSLTVVFIARIKPAVALSMLIGSAFVFPAETTPAQVPSTNTPQASAKTVEQMRAGWEKFPAEELRKLADGGNAEAAYVYGLQEMEKGREAVNAAFRHSLAAEPTGPVFKRDEVFARWQNVPREELMQAVAKQNREAQYYYGHIAADEGVARTRQGFDWVKKAAEQGLVPAQFDVGMFYARRMKYVVVDLDYRGALQWFQRAADQGHEPSLHQIADLQLEGLLGQPDLAQAVELLQRCVDLGCHQAEWQLAMLYSNGNGEPRHAGETPFALLKKAAAGKIPLAEIELAQRYRTGYGVDKNLVRAARFYVRASLDENLNWDFQNPPKEIFNLLTPEGRPKPASDPETFRFAEALAVQLRSLRDKEPKAMMEMAELELAAANDEESRLFAYYWLSRAEHAGIAVAAETRNRLEKKMSADELKQAKAEVATAVRLENESRR